MNKANTSPLSCIHAGCNTIPIIVLEFKQMGGGMKILLQIITCNEHRQEGIDLGKGTYPRSKLVINNYPVWLQMLHNEILREGTQGGSSVPGEDITRLKTFRESNIRRPIDRR